MSAVPLNRKLHYRAPACSTSSAACEGCSCGKANKTSSVWEFHTLAADCATRSEPCSPECTCERFAPKVELEYKHEPCAASAAPCAGCSCGKAALA